MYLNMYMRGITSMDQAELYFSWRIREMLSVKQVPQGELRRLGLMTTLLEMKRDKHREVQDNKITSGMIDNLFST